MADKVKPYYEHAAKSRLIVTPEVLKLGWKEFRPNQIPNVICHEYRNPVKRPDGNYEVDVPDPKVCEAGRIAKLREERDAWYQADCEAREKLVRAEAALAEMRSKTLDEARAIVDNTPLGYLTEREHEVLENFADRLSASLLALKGEPAPKEGK